MAARAKTQKLKNSKTQSEMMVVEEKKEKKETNEWGGEPLDPAEEKMLDWILKAIVVFILGWLGLGILLSVKGLIWPS